MVSSVFIINVLILILSPENIGFGSISLAVFGLILMILGLILWFWGYISLGSSFALFIKADHLVKSGAYRFFKHPIYIGMFLTFLGISIAKGTISGLIFTIAATLPLNYIRARNEEKALKAKFKKEYR